MYYTIKKIFNGQTKESLMETVQGVKDYLLSELCHDGMFIIVDWPVKFGNVTMIATDFKAQGESCIEFANRFNG